MNRTKLVCAMMSIIMLCLGGCASTQQSNNNTELSTTPNQSQAQKSAEIHLRLAVSYFKNKQHQVALGEIKKTLNIVPNYVDAHAVRALIYMDMGQNRLAENDFNAALVLDPKNADVANNYGHFLCQNGRAEEAFSYFNLALKNIQYRSPVKILINSGVCALKTNDIDKAQEYFNAAFKLDAANTITNVFLAKIYYEKDEYENARFYINRVIKKEVYTADVLWLATKIAYKLNDQVSVRVYISELSKYHPDSAEYVAAQRGRFDD